MIKRFLRFLLLLFAVAFATNLGEVKLGKVGIPNWVPPESPANENPTAYIDSITPSPVDSGVFVYFGGHGTDDGSVSAYSWYSSVEDAQISTDAAFDTAHLHVGEHTIWFKVQDDDDAWSDSVSGELTITQPEAPAESIGAEWYFALVPGAEPIGGGIGYSDIITEDILSNNHTSSYVVTGAGVPVDSFDAFIAVAGTGDTIFIRNTADMDYTDDHYRALPAGVIICSDRGATVSDTTSWGALIYTNTIESSAEVWRMFAKTRVTGLRFRGYWSELNEISLEDSVEDWTPSVYYALSGYADSIEIDNCELWGWSGSCAYISGSSGFNIHHNYVHHAGSIYKGYPWNCTGDSPGYSLTANLHHNIPLGMWGGGAGSETMHGNVSYNIASPKQRGSSFYWHSGTDAKVPTDTLFNNTFYCSGYTYGIDQFSGSAGSTNADSAYIHHNWLNRDSIDCFVGNMGAVKFKARINQYSTTPPDGVSSRLPTAVIVSDVDSGSAPLTVKFTATGSADADGSITTYHWIMGDSAGADNVYRKTTHDDTVTHIYGEIGLYTIELMVQDDDGIPAWAYKNILVKPESGIWLSVWINDRSHEKTNHANWFYKQILIDNDTVYNKDIAGANNWEHVVVDISSEVGASDSVTLEFRLACNKDTTANMNPWMHVDNAYIFGGTVLKGDFEGASWSGNYYGRDCDEWDGGYSGNSSYAVEDANMSFGLWGYKFTKGINATCEVGDYGFVKQRVDIVGQ